MPSITTIISPRNGQAVNTSIEKINKGINESISKGKEFQLI